MSFIDRVLAARNKELEASCERVGFYLVHSTGRFYISERVSEVALERVASKVLTDSDYHYWIDYSYGKDVTGKVAWCNVDQTDRFI